MHNLFVCKHSKKLHMFSNGGKYDQAHIEGFINTNKVVLNNLFPTFGGVSCSSRLSPLLRLSDSHLRTKKSSKPRSLQSAKRLSSSRIPSTARCSRLIQNCCAIPSTAATKSLANSKKRWLHR